MTSCQNSDSVNGCVIAYLLENDGAKIASRSDLKRQSLRFFKDGHLNKKKNKVMSSDLGSVVTNPKINVHPFLHPGYNVCSMRNNCYKFH